MIFLVLLLSGFCCFHVWLSCKGKTTKEYLKDLDCEQQPAYCFAYKSRVKWDLVLSPGHVELANSGSGNDPQQSSREVLTVRTLQTI